MRAPIVAIDASVLGRTRTGTAVYVNNLIQGIKSIGPPDLEIIRIDGPHPKPRRNLLSRPYNLLTELVWLHIRLPRILKKLDVDLLHMPAIEGPIYAPCPYVVTVHDVHFITHGQARDRFWLAYVRMAARIAVSRAAKIITDSDFARGEIEEHLKADTTKMRVIHLGAVSRRILPEDTGFCSDVAPYILFAGATMLHKNVHTLVDAFGMLIKDSAFSGYKLVIAGVPADGHELVMRSIDRNNLREKVVFYGYISDSQLAALYTNASLFAFPSKAEGFGLPPLEAMSHGTPVAASGTSCIPEVLGDAAVYFDPDNPENIMEVISDLLQNPERQRELINLGLERAAELTWEKTASLTLDTYRDALAHRDTSADLGSPSP